MYEKPFQCWIHPEDHERLRQMAFFQRRSMSEIVREAIAAKLDAEHAGAKISVPASPEPPEAHSTLPPPEQRLREPL